MFVAPAIAILGLFTVTDAFGRVQRAHPVELAIAFAVLLAAGWVMVIRPEKDAEPKAGESPKGFARFRAWFRLRSTLLAVGALLTAVGTGIAIYLTVETASYSPRPQITAGMTEDRKNFTATVTAEYMPPRQRIAIEVEAIPRDAESETQAGDVVTGERIYSAYVGPKSDGNVSHTLTVSNPAPEVKTVTVRAYTANTATPCTLGTRPALTSDEDYGSGTACVTTQVHPPRQPANDGGLG